jgi:hypothetical protein
MKKKMCKEQKDLIEEYLACFYLTDYGFIAHINYFGWDGIISDAPERIINNEIRKAEIDVYNEDEILYSEEFYNFIERELKYKTKLYSALDYYDRCNY